MSVGENMMQYKDEIMDQLRMEGDPILDKIVGEIFRTGQVDSSAA
jgi:hypothetical protein